MADRKIIFKCLIGSHLYGTNDESSDLDYSGVFLPSTEDLLGIENCPTEWTFNEKNSTGPRNEAGDVDCKYYSLKRFLELAAQGQPGQLEMLFVPDEMVEITTPEWEYIKANKDLFLSKNGIRPFIGFALAQAHKSAIEGDNLRDLMAVQEWGRTMPDSGKKVPICFHFVTSDDGSITVIKDYDGRNITEVERSTNEQGFNVFAIAGRKYDVALKTKTFLENVDKLINRYGTRSHAAMNTGLDFKSLSHAFRLVSQAHEFLLNGEITFPRPNAHWLWCVKKQGTGLVPDMDMDYFDEITQSLDKIKQEVLPRSKLPEQPDRAKINKLCQELLLAHLEGK